MLAPIFKKKRDILPLIDQWKKEGKKIVFTNGCFDLIHVGHIRLLKKAKEYGDVLVVALNTDDSIRRLKGEKRPILDEFQRGNIMASFEMVDAVVFFDEDTPEKILRLIKPHILVKGGDYKYEEIVGHDFIPSYGGKVISSIIVSGISTSKIIDKILSIYKK